MNLALVLLGGALGALARYLTDVAVASRFGRDFPWGTLVVNVVGSFVIGLVLGGMTGRAALFLATGFCGALTTYSTFAGETVGLLDQRAPWRALANMLLSPALGVAAAIAGVALTR